jgi:hypothetical protein
MVQQIVSLIETYDLAAVLGAISDGAEACGDHDGIDAYDAMASHLYDAVQSYEEALSFAALPRDEGEEDAMPLVAGILAAHERGASC